MLNESDFEDSNYMMEEQDLEDDRIDRSLFESNVDINEFNENQTVVVHQNSEDDMSFGDSQEKYLTMFVESDVDEMKSYVIYDPVSKYDPTFSLGIIFSSKKEFKEAVQNHAIKTMRSLKFVKNDKRRVYVRCAVEICNWKMNVLKDPKRRIKGFRKDVTEDIRCNISQQQAERARKWALKAIEGDVEEQYGKLWDYVEALRQSNPGSTIFMQLKGEFLNGRHRFSKYYICLKSLVRGFQSGCQPIIGVDGCHLKGHCQGILLTAIGIDPNNELFSLAYAVVRSETREAWKWFFTFLRKDLNIEHEVGFKGLAYKRLIWMAANASTIPDFEEVMKEIQELDPKCID
ncbi:uncharacterized protein LOC127262384 [Andrographis paniculata]|uniref:uncharacterized protein LOC127262384 n=1 Tax=Andrographis paniculata TaxID=175694 RepID=UPI0021E985F1|nr:uncharacterized protein LOC127262384 [Andrographis paniculata]